MLRRLRQAIFPSFALCLCSSNPLWSSRGISFANDIQQKKGYVSEMKHSAVSGSKHPRDQRVNTAVRANVSGSEPAAGVQGVAVDQPPTEEGDLNDHHGLGSGEGGVNDLHEAGVGRGELGITRRFHPERGEELNSGFFSDGGQEEQATPTPRHISRASSRARSRAKRIRITGALGEFLDGSGMWNDINFMEAERRFIQAAAAPSGSQDIQIQNDDTHSSGVTRQPQQQLQDYRADQRVQHGQQGEEESKGGEGEYSD